MTLDMTALDFARLERQVEEAVRKHALPACPEILNQIGAELRRDAPQVRRIADLIARDVAAAAGVLKSVNSAAYGIGAPARSVQQAIAYLGLDRTALLLAGLMLRGAFPHSDRAAMIRFWRDSARLASVAAFLGRLLGAAASDEAHTYGLFRDAGTAVLISRYADYDTLMAGCEGGEAAGRTDHEKAHFGTDHAVIGAVLARDWHLPEEMSDAILWHHADFVLALDAPPIRAEAVRLIALGVLGDCVLESYEARPASTRPASGLEHALRLLNLGEHELADVQAEALTRLAEREGRPVPTLRLRRLPA